MIYYNKIGKKYRVKYFGYISKNKYEIVAINNGCYIIGFNEGKGEREGEIIGWKSNQFGNKYKLFWAVQDIVDEKKGMEVE